MSERARVGLTNGQAELVRDIYAARDQLNALLNTLPAANMLPPFCIDDWMYGDQSGSHGEYGGFGFPMHSETRRTTRLCVPCYVLLLDLGADPNDWATLIEMREEATQFKVAA